MKTENIPVKFNELFYENLVKQIRSIDSYGAYSKYSDIELIEMKYLKPQDEKTQADKGGLNTKLYLQAVALTLEKLEGILISLMTESGCDGSVRAMFYTGRLILLEKTFGSISGFNFSSLEKLYDSSAKLIERMQKIVGQNKEKYKDLVG